MGKVEVIYEIFHSNTSYHFLMSIWPLILKMWPIQDLTLKIQANIMTRLDQNTCVLELYLLHRENSPITHDQSTPQATLLSWGRWPFEKNPLAML